MTSARLSGSNVPTSAHIKLLDDRRFRALLSDEDWGRLPLATWRRFSKRVADGDSVVYVGVVDEVGFSDIGWWFAQAARLIGGPLPTGRDTGVPMIVTVTEDGATGGQTWTRICARRRGFPQVIHSAKRFAGPTGLEEYVGCGVSMALRIAVEGEALTSAAPVMACSSGGCGSRCRHGSRRVTSRSRIAISARVPSASPSMSFIRVTAR